MMEYWNVGILGIKSGKDLFKDEFRVMSAGLGLFICRCLHPVPAGPLNGK
jgi:hypothetical protein